MPEEPFFRRQTRIPFEPRNLSEEIAKRRSMGTYKAPKFEIGHEHEFAVGLRTKYPSLIDVGREKVRSLFLREVVGGQIYSEIEGVYKRTGEPASILRSVVNPESEAHLERALNLFPEAAQAVFGQESVLHTVREVKYRFAVASRPEIYARLYPDFYAEYNPQESTRQTKFGDFNLP